MSAPYHLTLDRTTRRGHVLLRATSSINNVGKGPLELRGLRIGPRTMSVNQVIYHPNGTRFYRRTGARLGFHFVSGHRYGFTFPGESYWKFRGAATFQLWRVNANDKPLRLVRAGPKLYYCFRDLFRTRPSRRSPGSAVYPACNQDPSQRRVTLGTSVGWSDVYPFSYPQQWIDVTGLRGRFAYAMGADPLGFILESNELNNWSEVIISLPSGRVLARRIRLPQP